MKLRSFKNEVLKTRDLERRTQSCIGIVIITVLKFSEITSKGYLIYVNGA